MTESQRQMILTLEKATKAIAEGRSPNGVIVLLGGPEGPETFSCVPSQDSEGNLHPMKEIKDALTKVLHTYCHERETFDDGAGKVV